MFDHVGFFVSDTVRSFPFDEARWRRRALISEGKETAVEPMLPVATWVQEAEASDK
jgi:hypothetical protein